jgi:intracellular multiplication protein IcmL
MNARTDFSDQSSPRPRPDAAKGGSTRVGGLGVVVQRNEFYRDGYRILQNIAILQTLIIVGLVAAIIYTIHVNQPENRYFATTEDGRLIPMVPLSEPNLSDPALLSWAAQAASEVMTMGFSDYRRRLQEASRNFTPTGWAGFTTALGKAQTIDNLEKGRQVARAVPDGAPIITARGLAYGRYQWVMEIPLVVTYESGAGTRSDRILVQLQVVRVSRLESPSGVGIEQWVASPR